MTEEMKKIRDEACEGFIRDSIGHDMGFISGMDTRQAWLAAWKSCVKHMEGKCTVEQLGKSMKIGHELTKEAYEKDIEKLRQENAAYRTQIEGMILCFKKYSSAVDAPFLINHLQGVLNEYPAEDKNGGSA